MSVFMSHLRLTPKKRDMSDIAVTIPAIRVTAARSTVVLGPDKRCPPIASTWSAFVVAFRNRFQVNDI
jgi:hypothetical protein